jgi:molybdate transport system permease protein
MVPHDNETLRARVRVLGVEKVRVQAMSGFLEPLLLSLRVAISATALMLPIGLLAGWRLGVGRPFRGRLLAETIVALPLILPPTVVGYGLLLMFGRGTALGEFLQGRVGLHLLFTWEGAAVAAAVMAFPLFVRTAAAALGSVEPEMLEVGRTLGASELRLFATVLVPLAYRGLIAALTLAFARALGEFGATLMVAGNIPGKTQTLPLALYTAVQAGRDGDALRLALLLTTVAFVLLGLAGILGGRVATRRGERP